MRNITGTLLVMNIINSYIASLREYLIKNFSGTVSVRACAHARAVCNRQWHGFISYLVLFRTAQNIFQLLNEDRNIQRAAREPTAALFSSECGLLRLLANKFSPLN